MINMTNGTHVHMGFFAFKYRLGHNPLSFRVNKNSQPIYRPNYFCVLITLLLICNNRLIYPQSYPQHRQRRVLFLPKPLTLGNTAPPKRALAVQIKLFCPVFCRWIGSKNCELHFVQAVIIKRFAMAQRYKRLALPSKTKIKYTDKFLSPDATCLLYPRYAHYCKFHSL
jgi:hypothetical protein